MVGSALAPQSPASSVPTVNGLAAAFALARVAGPAIKLAARAAAPSRPTSLRAFIAFSFWMCIPLCEWVSPPADGLLQPQIGTNRSGCDGWEGAGERGPPAK